MINLKQTLPEIKELAYKVGKLQLANISEQLEVRTKSSLIDVVTNIDVLSEKIILEKIRELFPEHSILSEEKGHEDYASDYTWIIDPLDGTANYVHGYPFFAVSIALEYQGELILGVIYVPRLDEMFYAVKGEGAYLNGNKISVSQANSLEQALLVTGFPYDKKEDKEHNLKLFNQLVLAAMGMRRSGSAALDLCSIACGRLDGYWEMKLNIWDVAAGALIVKEAGGKVKLVRQKEKVNIAAANPKLLKEMLAEIGRLSEDFLAGDVL